MNPSDLRHSRSAAWMMAFLAVVLSISLILGPGAPRSRPGRLVALPCNASAPGAPSLAYLDAHFSHEAVWDYCWTHAAQFNVSAGGADARRSQLGGVRPAVAAGELVSWRLEARDAAGRPLGRGGDAVAAMLRGPSLVRPRVYDLRNGTYIIAFALADPGRYAAEVSLRWRACRAHVLCSVPDSSQPMDAVASFEFEVVGEANGGGDVPGSLREMGSGRWVAAGSAAGALPAPLRGDYVWAPWGVGAGAWGGDDLSGAHLRDRWVHVIGDSLSEHAWAELVEAAAAPACEAAAGAGAQGTRSEVANNGRKRLQGAKKAKKGAEAGRERPPFARPWVEQLVDRYTGERMAEQRRRDGMRLWRCPTLNATLSFVFYPDSFPVGGSKTTRYPLVEEAANAVPAAANVTFRVDEWTARLRAALEEADPGAGPPPPAPDAVVFNFGLHFAAQLDPPLYAVLLRHMVMRLVAEFPDRRATPLVWRPTGWTHFEVAALPERWNCRTPARVQVLNEVARRVVGAAGVDAVVDFEELTAARGDAAPDNRHFSRGNVRAAYNAALLRTLAELWGARGSDGDR